MKNARYVDRNILEEEEGWNVYEFLQIHQLGYLHSLVLYMSVSGEGKWDKNIKQVGAPVLH